MDVLGSLLPSLYSLVSVVRVLATFFNSELSFLSHQLDVFASEGVLLEVEGEAGLDVVVARQEDGEQQDEVRHHRQEAARHQACIIGMELCLRTEIG